MKHSKFLWRASALALIAALLCTSVWAAAPTLEVSAVYGLHGGSVLSGGLEDQMPAAYTAAFTAEQPFDAQHLQEGQIGIRKSAVEFDLRTGEALIELNIVSKAHEEPGGGDAPMDLVVIFDRTQSMTNAGRFNPAKEAALELVRAALDIPGSRAAVIALANDAVFVGAPLAGDDQALSPHADYLTYDDPVPSITSVWVESGDDAALERLEADLAAIKPQTGTNTSGAITLAGMLLAASGSGGRGRVVLITDGTIERSFKTDYVPQLAVFDSRNHAGAHNGPHSDIHRDCELTFTKRLGLDSADSAPKDDPDWQHGDNIDFTGKDAATIKRHQQHAVDAAALITQGGATVSVLAVAMKQAVADDGYPLTFKQVEQSMKKTSSAAQFFRQTSVSGLSDTARSMFEDFCGTGAATTPAATDTLVTDTLAEGVELIEILNDESDPHSYYDESAGAIIWTPGDLEDGIEYVLRYKVRVSPETDFENIPSFCPFGESTLMTFTANGEEQRAEFAQPGYYRKALMLTTHVVGGYTGAKADFTISLEPLAASQNQGAAILTVRHDYEAEKTQGSGGRSTFTHVFTLLSLSPDTAYAFEARQLPSAYRTTYASSNEAADYTGNGVSVFLRDNRTAAIEITNTYARPVVPTDESVPGYALYGGEAITPVNDKLPARDRSLSIDELRELIAPSVLVTKDGIPLAETAYTLVISPEEYARIDFDTIGVYPITVQALISGGGQAEGGFTVMVADLIRPEITVPAAPIRFDPAGGVPASLAAYLAQNGVSASDNYDGIIPVSSLGLTDVSGRTVGERDIDFSTDGWYGLYLTCSDTSGNAAIRRAVVIVVGSGMPPSNLPGGGSNGFPLLDIDGGTTPGSDGGTLLQNGGEFFVRFSPDGTPLGRIPATGATSLPIALAALLSAAAMPAIAFGAKKARGKTAGRP